MEEFMLCEYQKDGLILQPRVTKKFLKKNPNKLLKKVIPIKYTSKYTALHQNFGQGSESVGFNQQNK